MNSITNSSTKASEEGPIGDIQKQIITLKHAIESVNDLSQRVVHIIDPLLGISLPIGENINTPEPGPDSGLAQDLCNCHVRMIEIKARVVDALDRIQL